MKLINKSDELTVEDKIFISDIPNLHHYVGADQRSNAFFEAGNLVFITAKNEISKRSNHLYMYTVWKKVENLYPPAFGKLSPYPAYSNFYYALRFFEDQTLINKLTDIVDLINLNARKLIKKQEREISIIQIHGIGDEFPLHSHLLYLNTRVVTYAVKLGNETPSTARLHVGDLAVPILTDSNISRISFDPSIPHKVTIDPDDAGLYMWVTFDTISEFNDPLMFCDSDAIVLWNLTI